MKTVKAILISLCFCSWQQSHAQLRVSALIDDNMLLQRNQANAIWGWNNPGKTVKLDFQQKSYSAVTDAAGNWKIILPPFDAGELGDMIISSAGETKTIHNVAAGEVWVCSGQSNMEWIMSQLPDDMPAEMADCKNNNIRYLTVKKDFDNKERKDVKLSSSWKIIDSINLGNCSSVAYYFAKKLYQRLKVPIGLIVTSWGGTPAQAWTDTASLKAGFPNYYKLYSKDIRSLDFNKLEQKVKANEAIYHRDEIASSAMIREYLKENYNDKDWKNMQVPKFWEDQGYPDIDGVGALRIRVTLSAEDIAGNAVLHMPAIDDVDSTWINGQFVGSMHIWNAPRSYNIPASVLKVGTNIITIWILDTGGAGGLFNDPTDLYIQTGDKKISLVGPAKFKLLARVKPLAGNVVYAALQNAPAVLYNAMISPLLNYGIRGAIWYQGESNVDQYEEYRRLFPAMIKGWRNRWHQGDFPFLFVQLASFNPNIIEPELSKWARLREAQTMALRLPNTGMAVTTDVGDQKDIHPRQKRPVGERLALNAFKIAYGFKDEVNAGPLYATLQKDGDAFLVSFDNLGSGLQVKGDTLRGFAIAGADKKFVPAKAFISGERVRLSSPSVPNPVYVRYAWADAPLEANLYNKEGLPAVPFRTDKD